MCHNFHVSYNPNTPLQRPQSATSPAPAQLCVLTIFFKVFKNETLYSAFSCPIRQNQWCLHIKILCFYSNGTASLIFRFLGHALVHSQSLLFKLIFVTNFSCHKLFVTIFHKFFLFAIIFGCQ